jgi:predicted phage terminase large subunit-like protein
MARRVDDPELLFQADFWPRDHGKSEIFCIAYPLRRICEDPNIRILIVQKTAGEAEKTLAVIKQEMESNDDLKAYYAPHWRQTTGHADICNAGGTVSADGGKKEAAWQQRKIYVKRRRRGKDPTVEAVGVGGAITGGHFDIIILDDVEDDENTKTTERLKTLLSWFSGTILQLREPQTKIIVVGTFKTNAQDIYNMILENPVWSTVVKSALVSHRLEEIAYEPVKNEEGRLIGVEVLTPDVQTLWPQKWPIEALLFEMLAGIRSIWIREKLNDLTALAGKIFKREWFRYYDLVPDDFEQIVQAWDTAWEEHEGADWSVCVTAGLRQGQIYILDVFRAKLETPDLLKAMRSQWEHWKPQVIVVEDKASGKSALQILKRESTLPVVAISPGTKDKVARARAVTPYLESGRLHLRQGALWLQAFEDELVMFPEGGNDDQVDALVYVILRLMTEVVDVAVGKPQVAESPF